MTRSCVRPLLLSTAAALTLSLPLSAQGTAAPAPGPATRVARAVNPAVMRAHLEFLADDALEGRAPGTRGGLIAARYIRSQFERLGLRAGGRQRSYYHRVPIISLTPKPTLRVSGGEHPELRYRDDFVLWSMRNDSLVPFAGIWYSSATDRGSGIQLERFSGGGREGKDRRGAGERPRPHRLDDLPRKDPYLLWALDLQDRGGGAAGSGGDHSHPYDRERHLSMEYRCSPWTGAQVRVERPATTLLVAGWLSDKAAAALFPRRNRSGQHHATRRHPWLQADAAWHPARRRGSK